MAVIYRLDLQRFVGSGGGRDAWSTSWCAKTMWSSSGNCVSV
ncbi:hypothetical protein E2C01_075176 [Portunus trituberculatus]|uniref:Uncharacterized protein n=1 Tax=Portunus trituberculatus TaxID=210409 RepID=A0A5B7IEB8_PORTR|nr:hypothetical protein [Portunus trituberculatus]